eukprot:scaffold43864_cov59-Phaeocystis_antarctica.AAC.4
MRLVVVWLGTALTTLVDSALSPSSFHHPGLATSLHAFSFSRLKAPAVALAHFSGSTGKRSLASRNRCAASTKCPELDSAAPRLKYAVGWSGLSAMASRHKLLVRVTQLLSAPGLPLRELAHPLLHHPTILVLLPLLPQPLVKRPVQLPSARVRRAVDAAQVRRRQLLVAAHVADGVLLTLVVHL